MTAIITFSGQGTRCLSTLLNEHIRFHNQRVEMNGDYSYKHMLIEAI
jgi:hypothetical protein